VTSNAITNRSNNNSTIITSRSRSSGSNTNNNKNNNNNPTTSNTINRHSTALRTSTRPRHHTTQGDRARTMVWTRTTRGILSSRRP
jgi:hypothetical protein